MSNRFRNIDFSSRLALKADIADQASIYPTLVNSWESWGVAPFEVHIDGLNRVCITGGVSGGTYSDGTEIITLPVGYRPIKNIYSFVLCADQLVEVRITTDGKMVCQGFPTNVWVSFDNIVPFRHA